MTNGNAKGKRGERELAHELTCLFGTKCRRGQQYSGIEGKDVIGLHGVHIECKRTETLSVYKAMEQAIRDATGDDVPIVCHRRNQREWLAIVRLSDLTRLMAALNEVDK